MKLLLLIICAMFSLITYAQVGVNNPLPNASSALDITSTSRGVLIPRMTAAERLAINSPAQGLLVYQTGASEEFYYFNGTIWITFTTLGDGGGDTWQLTGNSGTNEGVNFIGTTDDSGFVFRTDNSEAMRVTQNATIGIGTTITAGATLQIGSANAGDASIFGQDFETGIPPLIDPMIIVSEPPENSIAVTAVPWFIQMADVSEGSQAVQSGAGDNENSTDNSRSALEITLNVGPTPVSLSFDFKTNITSAPGNSLIFNSFSFIIDGTLNVLPNNTGGVYQTAIFTIPAGTHTLQWSHQMVFGGFENGLALLDNIRIGAVPSPILRIEDGNQADGRILISDAQGNATWADPLSAAPGADDDWRFNSGNTSVDPIYRTGEVAIGPSNPFPRDLLDVFNSTSNGSEMGLGSTEFFTDGDAEYRFSHDVVPLNNNTSSMGNSGIDRWIEVFASNGVINTSDSRDKESIKPLSYTSVDLLKISPVSYQWKEERYGTTVLKGKEKKTKVGFLAQNLKGVIPEAVVDTKWVQDPKTKVWTKKSIEILGVAYVEILPLIVKSIQEKEKLLQQIEKEYLEIEQLLKTIEK